MVPQKKEALLPLKDFSSSSGVSFTERDISVTCCTCEIVCRKMSLYLDTSSH